MRYGPSTWARPEGYPCARRNSMAKAAQIVNCYVYSGLMAPVTEMRVAAGISTKFWSRWSNGGRYRCDGRSMAVRSREGWFTDKEDGSEEIHAMIKVGVSKIRVQRTLIRPQRGLVEAHVG